MSKIKLPVTRYYGSKRKLIERIWNEIENLELEFSSVLDIFGGTAIFSYYSKVKGKTVFYNDIFTFNSLIGRKLIEQTSNELTYEHAVAMLQPVVGKNYVNTIQENFEGIYFTNEENAQIDIFIQNANSLENENQRLSAYYLIFQACIIKRPYNLFHRNNLNMRLNYTRGNFGNKKTWERPFDELFYRFITELNEFTFDNGHSNRAFNSSALNCNVVADLVYIDPPYFNSKGHHTTYHSKYHFLEGLANYSEIGNHINHDKINKEIIINKSDEFEKPANFLNDLEQLILNHVDSIIVISYRNNGVPTIKEISSVLKRCKPHMKTHTIDLGMYGYALNKSNQLNNEFLIVGTNNPI